MKLIMETWRKLLNEEKLRVFDFDDTLAITDSKIHYKIPRRTKDGGISGNGITSQNGTWEAPITYDPDDQMRIYDFGADIYVSDFGELKVVPSRFSRDRTISIVQKDMWAVAYLRPFKVWELSKTGDSEKRLLLAEYTLESRNEAASAKVADLKTDLL